MTTSSDQHLYQLYSDLGDAQSAHGDKAAAADAYALALYYARRMSNDALASLCRRKVVENNPHHVAAQQTSAPLHFAQLLMRYPADEAEKMLVRLRQSPQPAMAAVPSPFEITTAFSMQTGGLEEEPSLFQPPTKMEEQVTQPTIDLPKPTVKPQAPVLPFQHRPEMPSVDQFEQHHVFDLGSGEMGSRAQSLRVTEEFLQPNTPAAAASREDESSELAMAIHFAAICAVIVGLVSIGFFAVQMYPSLSRVNLERVVKTLMEFRADGDHVDSFADQETIFESELPPSISMETLDSEVVDAQTVDKLPTVRIEQVSDTDTSPLRR